MLGDGKLFKVKLPGRKSQLERVLEKVKDSLDVSGQVKSGLPDALNGGRAQKAGLLAGAVAVLTAGSAGISNLRQRDEGARGDS